MLFYALIKLICSCTESTDSLTNLLIIDLYLFCSGRTEYETLEEVKKRARIARTFTRCHYCPLFSFIIIVSALKHLNVI